MPVACGILLLGLVFQLACRKIPLENAKLPAISEVLKPGTPEFGVAFGLLGHALFIVGMIAYSLALLILGLALKLAPELAVFPAFATIVSWLWFMKIMKISPVGVPGIAGPPIPALIINSIIVLVILINLIVNWEWLETVSEAKDDFPDFSPLARFILVSVLPVVSHLIAFKHRQTDWKVQPDGVDPL
eukprot:g5228.t1